MVAQLADRITEHGLAPDDLLIPTRDGTPISRNTSRTRVSRPAIATSGIEFDAHAHASWLLAGGSNLKSVVARWVTPK